MNAAIQSLLTWLRVLCKYSSNRIFVVGEESRLNAQHLYFKVKELYTALVNCSNNGTFPSLPPFRQQQPHIGFTGLPLPGHSWVARKILGSHPIPFHLIPCLIQIPSKIFLEGILLIEKNERRNTCHNSYPLTLITEEATPAFIT